MAYHAKKAKTDCPKTPTKKATAAGAKMDNSDDEDEDDKTVGGLTYSKKEPYHTRLKKLLGDGSFDPATVQLRDFLKVHKDYKQFKRNSLHAAFDSVRSEFTSREAVDGGKGLFQKYYSINLTINQLPMKKAEATV
jgi:hypothetical protein